MDSPISFTYVVECEEKRNQCVIVIESNRIHIRIPISINKRTIHGNAVKRSQFVPVASADEMIAFANIVESQTLSTLRDTLLPKLLSGKLGALG